MQHFKRLQFISIKTGNNSLYCYLKLKLNSSISFNVLIRFPDFDSSGMIILCVGGVVVCRPLFSNTPPAAKFGSCRLPELVTECRWSNIKPSHQTEFIFLVCGV